MAPNPYANQMLRAEGFAESVVDAILACKRSPRRESLGALAASLGFDGFSYIVLGSPSTQPRILGHWTSASASWTARYAARGYHLVDPRVTKTATGSFCAGRSLTRCRMGA